MTINVTFNGKEIEGWQGAAIAICLGVPIAAFKLAWWVVVGLAALRILGLY